MHLQRNWITGASDRLGTHQRILREHYSYAVLVTPDVEKQNRIVMARLLTAALVAAGCSDDSLTLRVQLQVLRADAFPSPATIQRVLAALRSDPTFWPIDIKAHYETEVWKRRRNLYFETHEKVCALDSSHTGRVNLHHRNYERVGQEFDADLIPLCRPCHAKFHDVMP